MGTPCLWTTSLAVEYKALPDSAARQVRNSIPRPLTTEQRTDLAQQTHQHLLSQWLGRDTDDGLADTVLGFPAYLKWVATDGTMQCPRVFDDSMHTVTTGDRQLKWLIRVIVSLGLLNFTLLSQCLSLSQPPTSAEPPTPTEST